MRVVSSLAVKRVLWALSFGLVASFCSIGATGCAGGDKKEMEDGGPDDAGSDAAKKEKKKGKKDHKKKDKKKDKKKGGEAEDAAAKEPT